MVVNCQDAQSGSLFWPFVHRSKQVVPALGCSEEQGMTTRIRENRPEHPVPRIRIAVREFVYHKEVQTDPAQ
jgi:hypothetical protein